MIPMSLFGQLENSKKFIEINAGAASIDDYDFSSTFPGVSVLFGQTFEFTKNGIFEYQIGVALPSLITGKVALGIGNIKNNFALAIRPWPLTIGPQGKIGNFSFSFEVGNNDTASFEAGLIATVGYRFKLGERKKASDGKNDLE
jgi:hypothetical protein